MVSRKLGSNHHDQSWLPTRILSHQIIDSNTHTTGAGTQIGHAFRFQEHNGLDDTSIAIVSVDVLGVVLSHRARWTDKPVRQGSNAPLPTIFGTSSASGNVAAPRVDLTVANAHVGKLSELTALEALILGLLESRATFRSICFVCRWTGDL